MHVKRVARLMVIAASAWALSGCMFFFAPRRVPQRPEVTGAVTRAGAPAAGVEVLVVSARSRASSTT